MSERKLHWEQVYQTKSPEQVSWTQAVPQLSLDLIRNFNLPKDVRIIDVGGGDSKLVDFLLADGYEHITVLDISEEALNRAKRRLGDNAAKITWIVSDILNFSPECTYDLWHDRAAFHFLTTQQQIEIYLNITTKSISRYLVMGTFSENGPDKCSGLQIKKYSEKELQLTLAKNFDKVKCITENHLTPFNTFQNFVFCSFERNLSNRVH
jgi:SAM-dependent methyltransferase